jgi:hypothetical protein
VRVDAREMAVAAWSWDDKRWLSSWRVPVRR